MDATAPVARTLDAQLHRDFLSVLPRIEAHAHAAFRYVRCPDRRADAVQEAVALAFAWFRRLRGQGKNPLAFPTALATFAARHVKAGRRLTGQEPARDALSFLAQRRHGFTTSPLPAGGGRGESPFDEALQDNRLTPVPEQAAFRLDWPAWLATRTHRDRRIIADLALSHRTTDLARKYGLSPARISQLRREFHADWGRFADPEAARDLAGI